MTMTMIGKTWSRYCLLVRDLTSTSFPLESSFAISGTISPSHTSTGTMRQFCPILQGLMFPNKERSKESKGYRFLKFLQFYKMIFKLNSHTHVSPKHHRQHCLPRNFLFNDRLPCHCKTDDAMAEFLRCMLRAILSMLDC